MNRNERTPRTLAETSFHTGYPTVSAEVHRAGRRGDALILVVAVVVSAALFGPSLLHAVARFFGG